MDFSWTAEEEFRQEIRAFLQAELPEGWGSTQFWDPDDDVSVSRSIAAGTAEIQRNIIAERGLSLPR